MKSARKAIKRVKVMETEKNGKLFSFPSIGV